MIYCGNFYFIFFKIILSNKIYMNKKIVFLLLLLFGLFFISGLNLMGEKVVSYNTLENFQEGNIGRQIKKAANKVFGS